MEQNQKAAAFKAQHQSAKIVLLPNIWDAMTAKLMESLGFSSLATASISLAAVNGYADGQQIPLELLLQQVAKIVQATKLPVSVDFERGYAKNLTELAENIRRLLDTGAVGINIEDSAADGLSLNPVADQCRILQTIRSTASRYGIDLVINARTDAYLRRQTIPPLQTAIARAKAYRDAGADCFYPILLNNINELKTLIGETTLPVNILLTKAFANLQELEQIGVKRVSLGPGLLKYAITKIRNMVSGLQEYDTDDYFEEEPVTTDFLNSLISPGSD